MSSQVYLGFDYGEKFIGVAVGNTLTRRARPLTTLKNFQHQTLWDDIHHLIAEWQPSALVLGLPLNMDDSENQMTKMANKFGKRLQGRYNLTVHMVDERLTTKEARAHFTDQEMLKKLQKTDLDEMAAALILQAFLNELKESS